jgi:PAS domain S-box-containing protein
MKKENNLSPETLRQQAEKLFKKRPEKRIYPRSEGEMLILIHELELQKLELVIQNEALVAAVSDENESTLKYLGLSKEVSDRKYAEERYRSIFESMQDAFFEANIDGILLDISPSIEIISKGQYTRAELVGTLFTGYYLNNDDRNTLLSEITEKGKVSDYEMSFINKDNSVVPVAISSSLLYENGRPVKITGIMRDITERKQAENALRESEKRYRSLANSGQALIWASDLDKKCTYFNQVWLDFTGRTYEQEYGDGWAEGVHPDDLERCFKIYSTSFDKREPFGMVYRLRRHDGEYRYLQDNGTPQYNSHGEFIGYIGHCLEITELKLAEEAQRGSDEKYRNIFINSQEGIFQTNVDGSYLSVNPALAKMYGFDSPGELMKSRMNIAKDAYSDPHERDNFLRLMREQGFVKGYEYEVKRKDGQKIWFYEDAKAIKDEFGNILFFEGFVVDITERKEAENSLKDKTILLTNLIINLQEGILLENAKRQIALTNQLFCDMFGIPVPPDLLTGSDCSNSAEQSKTLFKNPEKFLADIDLILANKKVVYSDELELVDGRFFERDYIPTYLDHEYSGHLWKYRDITERKQSQLKIQESEERFRQVVGQSREVVWEVDALGLYTYVSPLSKHVYGYFPEQLVGKMHFYDISPEHGREEFKKAALNMFGQKTSFENLINSVCRPDGKIITVETNGIPMLNDAGLLIGYRGIDSDITEKVLSENIRKKSEEVYRLITERSNDLIYVFRIKPDMGFEYVSPSAERITGFTPEEHYNDPQLGMKLVHPDDKHMLQSWKNGTISAGLITLRWIKKDGSVIWTESQNIPIYNEKGDVIAIQGKATDITERKQAELIVEARLRLTDFAASHSSYELQQKLLDELEQLTGSTIGFFHAVNADQETLVLQSWSTNTINHMCKADGKNLHYNINKAGIWAECVQLKKAVIHNDYSNIANRKGIPEGHAPVIRELVIPIFRNELIVAVVGIGNKYIDYNEKDIELVSKLTDMAWDITARKGAEESLKKLSQAVEQSPESIYITSLDGIIEYVNPKVRELTGYSDEELIGKNPRLLSSGEKPKDEYSMLWQTINEGNDWKGEFHNKKKNGELYWVSASISPVTDTNGKITHYLAVEEDITERKKNEEKISQQNERLNAIVSAMPDLIFVIDTKGTYLEFYQSHTNARSIPVNKVIGTNLKAFFNKEQADNYLQNIRKCIQDNKLIAFEYQLSEGNSTNYYEARLTPYGNDKVLSFVRDVTERVYSEQEIQNLNTNLELKIVERTSQLAITNSNLIIEIEERNKAAAALEEALDTLRKIADRVPGFVYQFRLRPDGSSSFPFASEGIYEVCGVKPGDVSEDGLVLFDTIFPDDFDNMNASILQSAKELSLWMHEFRIIFKDGSVRWLFGNALPQAEADGSILWHGFISDITERKEAEEELKQVSTRLSLAALAGGVGVWDLDIVNNILVWDKQMFELYGIEEKDFGGAYEAWLKGVHPEDVVRGNEEIQKAIRNEKEFDTEFRVVWPDSTIRIIRAMGIVQRDSAGNPLHLVGTNWDITAQKHSEDALRESEAKHSSMISNISDVIGIMGADGLMKYKSPNITKDFGWQPEDLIGTNGWLTVHPDDLERIQNEFYAVLQKDNVSKTVEYKYLCKDGSYKPIELTATNLINDKVINGVLLNYHDISARKLAEEEIIKARYEAEKANLAKSEFLSRMSHELRTPMNSILGFAQLLDMGELTPLHRKGVNHILNSGKHLLDLINEVLDISRIEAGRISLSMEPLKLNSVILEMLDIVQPQATKRNLTIELLDSPSNMLSVIADNQRFKQVILNLINNAVKYNREGGSIKIKTELLSRNLKAKARIRISVIDTGTGIKADEINKLFLPFERIGAEKTETEGTGLGLTVVKKLMDAMGGSVGVESIPGEGSTFWIELLQSKNKLDNMKELVSAMDYESGGTAILGTILYIEDNASNIELVEQILAARRSNVRLIFNKTGKQAVSLALEYTPDLILLDLDLPDIHGSQVLKNLQENEATRSIPVVIISADAMHHQVEKLIDAGARKYLTKPLHVLDYLKVIDEYIG